MKVTEFTYCNPDSDGDIRLEGTAVIENKADFDVELVKVSCTVLNSSGVTVGGNTQDDENVFINPKSSEEIHLSFGWGFHQDAFAGELDKMSALIEVTAYKRDFVKIGSCEVPDAPGKLSMIKKNISLGGLGEVRGVSVLRKKDDDDGNLDIAHWLLFTFCSSTRA